jgi:predicted site-specific integrase-resolvase
MLGVRVSTVAVWTRGGKLTPWITPGGQRRYRLSEVGRLQAEISTEEERDLIEDAVRLYEQGWSTGRVAGKLGLGYGTTRRLLMRRTTLRPKGGARPRADPPR